MKTLITLLLSLAVPLSLMAEPPSENAKAVFEIDTENSSMSIE